MKRMIDYEVQIFNNVYDTASSLCAKNRFLSTPIDSYALLPAASLYEMDNAVLRRAQSSTPIENFARVTYMLDIAATTKEECRTIFLAIDEKMISMNFNRISAQYITYPDNPSVVRYAVRYEAEIDADGNIYRRR